MKLLKDYVAALMSIGSIFPRRAFHRRTLDEELQEAMLRGSLRKLFGGFDLVCLGLGILIGSGWAQFTGTAGVYAGTAVIVSVLVSGLSALLSGACFAELCVEFPVSGGAFSQVMITFGEMAAFITVASLVLEYVTGMALVARGFSTYLARLFDKPPDFFRVGPGSGGGRQYDLMAMAIVLVTSAVMCLGMRESSFLTNHITVAKLVLLVFISIVGYTAASASNMQPFLNPLWDEEGIFLGSSIIFFSYVGFDALGSTAEEVKNINHMPWAIVASISASAVLYFMLALAMVLMTAPNIACPYSDYFAGLGRISFVTVFDAVGLHWVQYVVSVAALLGILTSLLVGLFAVSRAVMAASRDWLLPPFLARISPRTQTPVLAQLVLGVVIAILAMTTNNNAVVPLVSFGTLAALWMVCNSMLFRRYSPGVHVRVTRHGTIEAVPTKSGGSGWVVPGRRRMQLSLRTRRMLVWGHLLAINAACIALAAFYQATASRIPDTPQFPSEEACKSGQAQKLLHGIGPLWFLAAWAALTVSFWYWCPLEYEPPGWRIPWWMMPWLPSTAILLLVFNVAALPNSGYAKIAVYYTCALVFYLVFSLPMSYIKHCRVDYASNEDLNVVEIAFIEGCWQPVKPAAARMSAMTARSASSNAFSLGRSMELKPYMSGAHISVGTTASSMAIASSRLISGPVPSAVVSITLAAGGEQQAGELETSAGSFGAGPPSPHPPSSIAPPATRQTPPSALPPTIEEEARQTIG